MSYEKTTWQNGDIITAEKLNNIEDGIEDADTLYFKAESANAEAIVTAVKAGRKVVLGISSTGGPDNGLVTYLYLSTCTRMRVDDETTPSGAIVDNTNILFSGVLSVGNAYVQLISVSINSTTFAFESKTTNLQVYS